MRKLSILGLICLLVFAYCKSPADPKIEEALNLTINYFIATPESITVGESSTLSWNVVNAYQVSIDNGIGGVELVAGIDVFPLESTTYELTASKSTETLTASCEVIVDQNPGFAHVIVIEESCGWSTTYVRYKGSCKNVGEKTAYNVEVHLEVYHGGEQVGYLYALGTANGLSMEPGERRFWDFRWYTDFECDDLEVEYDITWDDEE